MNRLLRPTCGLTRALHLAVATGIVLGGGALAGCGSAVSPIEPLPGVDTISPLTTTSNVDRIDLLLVLDNSRSMADKQQVLASAVPDLVGSLVNPRCLDATGAPTPTQPADPLSSCPSGAHRAFPPITDIHVGIITSSLGGHGADTCSVAGDTQSCPGGTNPSNNDAGHLVTRQDACGGASVPTYGDKGFLAWDPQQTLSPPGEAQVGTLNVSPTGVTSTATPGLVPSLKDLVLGVGQIGCGFPSQLESWYRFLADPDPYQTITTQDGKSTPQGTDTLLLKERADFLRPTSLLSIVMLSDGNDCSFKESGPFYLGAQQHALDGSGPNFHLPRARKECATNPDDPCCRSCAQPATNCPVDDTCTASPTLSDAEDPIELRCFDQKRRFGVDLLYPIDRYTSALESDMIADRQGDMVPNPIFNDVHQAGDGSVRRDPSLVFLSGIVGVPWQDLARDPADLTKGFQTGSEMAGLDGNGVSTWDRILGDPAHHVPALDPHMIESTMPRPGLAGPTAPAGADPISGHEHSFDTTDLQYACVFGLPAPRDCSIPGVSGCDCSAGSDSPLCDPVTPTLQVRAKAYPGLRELATLKSLGNQGLVGSICPTQLADPARADYGYRPVLGGLVDRLATSLTGRCLPRQLTPDAQGQVACTIIEARKAQNGCSCDTARARRDVPAVDQSFAAAVANSSVTKNEGFNCLCELVQAGDPDSSTPEELAACLGDPSEPPFIDGGKDNGAPVKGWCYVDPSQSAAANGDIVKNCQTSEQRMIRFAGDTLASGNSALFINCPE